MISLAGPFSSVVPALPRALGERGESRHGGGPKSFASAFGGATWVLSCITWLAIVRLWHDAAIQVVTRNRKGCGQGDCECIACFDFHGFALGRHKLCRARPW